VIELLIFQNRDGQPTFKFHRIHDAKHIYRLIPGNKHFDVLCGHERHEKPPIGGQFEWYQKWQAIQGNQAFLVSVEIKNTSEPVSK
jgi:hypothetical protein